MLGSYITFMFICFGLFVVVSVALIPIAWLIGIYDKSTKSNTQNMSPVDKIINYLFIPFGPIILLADLVADFLYFWKNNFRTELKQNIILKKKSNLTHNSLKELDGYTSKMVNNKIKSVTTGYLIRHFRARYNVMQNLQFIMFGQMIPKDGFKDGATAADMSATHYKS